jgi:acetolactate synthase-1/3 small subunit
VPEAISNILYTTPTPSKEPPKRHVLNCLVQNEPGVLSRVSGILAARGFNIDSLVVCNTEVEDLSRMTIALRGQDGVIEQARRQLEDLVPVWAVLDYTRTQIVERELLLAKVSLLGPEHFHELLTHHKEEMSGEAHEDADGHEDSHASPFHPVNLAPSEALRQKHIHLQSLTELSRNFGGRVVDISTNTCIVELCAKPSRIDNFIVLLKPFGVLEAARSGMMALPRTPLETGVAEEVEMDEADVVDISNLPPG